MTDLRDDLRELLQRRADKVPPHRGVPRSLAGRARRRIALNALGVGLAVVVLAGGAFAGVRAIGTSTTPSQGIAGQRTHHGRHSPPATAPSACTAGQLRAVGSMQGAMGSREGGITLTNFSDTTCTLQGTPTIELLDQNLQPITSGVTFSASPAGWPVVTLHAGDAALVRIRWGNWCPQGRAAPLWRVDIPGGGSVDVVNGMDQLGPPPCNGPGLPSTVEVGPFEPTTSR